MSIAPYPYEIPSQASNQSLLWTYEHNKNEILELKYAVPEVNYDTHLDLFFLWISGGPKCSFFYYVACSFDTNAILEEDDIFLV